MALKITAPPEDKILIDANITEITVEDTGLYQYYFALIYINNEEFDHVVLPKFAASKMLLSFSNLIAKYAQLPNDIQTGLTPVFLDYDLKIELYKQLPSAVLMDTFNYKLRYSVLPTNEQYHAQSLAFIAVDADMLVIGNQTTVQLPFFTLDNHTDIRVRLIDNNYNFLYDQLIPNDENAHAFVCSIPFENTTNADILMLEIKVGDQRITKNFRVLKNTVYENKKIRFYNRFGFPMVVDVFGKFTAKDELTYQKYQNAQGVYRTAEITTDTLLAIDTGYLLESEKAIVEQITQSLSVEIFHKGVFVPCVATTKAVTTFAEKEFHYTTQLQFEFNKNPKIKN